MAIPPGFITTDDRAARAFRAALRVITAEGHEHLLARELHELAARWCASFDDRPHAVDACATRLLEWRGLLTHQHRLSGRGALLLTDSLRAADLELMRQETPR